MASVCPTMECDVVIVGAGPVGLEVAAALQADGLHTLVLDAGAIGQTIAALFPPQTRFFSSPERLEIGGVAMALPNQEKPTGEEYLAYLRSVVLTLDLQVRTFERVIDCSGTKGAFTLHTETPAGLRATLQAKHVVLAVGGTQHSRTLGVEGEDLPHVHRLLGDPHRFFQRRVLIVGGKNSAVESALRCWRVGAQVTLACRSESLHKRVKYWLRPEVNALLDEGQITSRLHTAVQRIHTDHVELLHMSTGITERMPVDDVLLQLGFEADTSTLELFGLDLHGEACAPVFDADTMESSIPGIFVAGTAIAGSQRSYKVYIETSHVHAARIAAAIGGRHAPDLPTPRLLPES